MNSRVMLVLAGLGIFCFSGCAKNAVQFGLSGTGQNFQQSSSSFTNELDILWVVDNSSSMDPLQANMTTNFGAAVNNFIAKGWDFRMAVTTTDTYLSEAAFNNDPSLAQFRDGTPATSTTGVFVILPTTPNLDSTFVTNATQGATGSGDERAFSSLRDTMNSNLNAGFLRPTSFFAVIILSDEDDFSGVNRPEYSWTYTDGIPDHDYSATTLDTVQSYESYLDTLTGTTGVTRRYNVSSIAVLDPTCLAAHIGDSPSSVIGQRYIQMTQDTNGVTGSICDTSYANSLNAIAQQIAELSTQFYLNNIPNLSTLQVVVNGQIIPEDSVNGWTYNSAANSIMFHGDAIPPEGASIGVNFTPTVVNH